MVHLERPLTNSPCLFVSLKGRRRGQPITPAALRSLFRRHRLRSEIPAAPHRFRHYRQTNRNLHVRGYKEEGAITTAFDMRVQNDQMRNPK